MPMYVRLVRLYRMARARRSLGVLTVLVLVLISLTGNAVCFYVFDGAKPESDISFADALWYSVISVTTIGYGDYSAQSAGARVGTIVFVVLIGMSAFTVFLGMLIDWTTTVAIRGRYGMGKIITSDHVLIVNFPSEARVRRLIEELKSDPMHRKRDVAVISDRVEHLPFEIDGVLFVHGSPLDEQTYHNAQIKSAAMAIVLALSYEDPNSDAVVSSAVSVIKSMNSTIRAVAECLDDRHLRLFESAGCNAVVQSLRIADNLLVQELNDPGVAQMADVITSNLKGATLQSTEVVNPPPGLDYADLAKKLLDDDVNVLCFNRGHETFTSFRDRVPRPGDRIVYIASERFSWAQIIEKVV